MKTARNREEDKMGIIESMRLDGKAIYVRPFLLYACLYLHASFLRTYTLCLPQPEKVIPLEGSWRIL